jgi:hypothetical protein
VPLRPIVDVVPVDELLVSFTKPFDIPGVAGSNSISRVAVFPGFRVEGKFTPEIVYPAPLVDPLLIVTDVVPDEVSVTDWYSGLPSVTSPKATLVDCSVRIDVAAPRLISMLTGPPPDDAVSVAIWAVLTAQTVAVKVFEVAFEATFTIDGTDTARLLLDRYTALLLVPAAALSVTVQMSVPAPVIDALVQLRPLTTACPVPLTLIDDVSPVEELLVSLTLPLTGPSAAGAKLTDNVAD